MEWLDQYLIWKVRQQGVIFTPKIGLALPDLTPKRRERQPPPHGSAESAPLCLSVGSTVTNLLPLPSPSSSTFETFESLSRAYLKSFICILFLLE